MEVKEAIEFLQKEFIEGNLDPMKRRGLEEIIALLKTKQELVTKFSSECEVYQKDLDQIDLWAMEIEDWLRECNEIPINVKNSISHWIKKIRGKI